MKSMESFPGKALGKEAEFEVHSLNGLSQIFSVSLDKPPASLSPLAMGYEGTGLLLFPRAVLR